uniref:Probable lysine-specific demethylase ELF6 n=1 Tax=Nicotiana tabacum TaxID=4097 RepID=A0A1S3YGF2_TOBAC|nr:PREDICTED: probable lysine-specific demethylase ELF6 [Nicotiana tabacum]XP_016451017.1 PREDICTED: probable lysine-specific demethylase ELF6 [Nicotiana tabacum]
MAGWNFWELNSIHTCKDDTDLGFNCGEAANFGTPQWLTVAKEAAVRRAAMNYLPMLSHQQLLYLLTMSFVSSVPRSLLPGVRTSRLRDRQKEEKELLVKKAFLEDIEKENDLVKVLLQKSFSDNAVLWDVDILPSSGKEYELHKHASVDASRGNDQSDSIDSQDLLDQMSLYMDNYSDFYVDDDVSCDFEIDSGTLPCIACGILGFPFMTLVQPSKKAAEHLFPEDFQNKQDSGAVKHVESDCHSDLRGMIEDYNRVDRMERNGGHYLNHDEVSLSSQPSESAVTPHEGQTSQSHNPSHTDNAALTSKIELQKEWDFCTSSVRPRIFCLEHAIQTEELLHTKGGANVLVICHSDFQKIRSHATIVAEEIGTSFKYNEISLANASQGHLSLIDLAIVDEEQDKCTEDWTLKLNINLRHCVKVQKNCPLKKLKHALTLGGLFSDSTLSSESSSLKWQSRKVRSKRKSNNSTESPAFANVQIEKVLDSGSIVGRQNTRKGNITIQYSRKKYKSKACSCAEVTRAFVDPFNGLTEEVLLTDAKTFGSSTLIRDENAGTASSGERFFAAPEGKPGLHHEHEMLLVNRDQNGNLLVSQEADLLVTSSIMVEFNEAQAEICTTEKFSMEEKTCHTNSNNRHAEHKTTAPEISGDTEVAHVNTPACTTIPVVRSTANNENLREDQDMIESGIRNKSAHPTEADFEIDHHGEADKAIMTRSPVPVNSSGSCTDGPSRSCDEQIEDQSPEQSGSGSEASDNEISDNSVEQKIQIDNADQGIAVSDHVTPVEEASASAGSLKVTRETSSPKHSQSGDNISERHKKESNDDTSPIVSRPIAKSGGKRRRELELLTYDGCSIGGFVKSPCEGLRPRARKNVLGSRVDTKEPLEDKPMGKKVKTSLPSSITHKDKKEQRKGTHRCDLEGCRMSFQTKVELQLHKRNRCPIEGCGKKFTSHKYALVHQRVHENDRPLRCPWKGCTMTFKWAWARTEHLRVHTGERPYKCKVEGCGLTFRFVSDYSRHRRKTGHYVEAAN